MGTSGSDKPAEPPRSRPDPAVSARYARLARTGTAPETALRRELHRRGRRFRVHARIEGLPRRRVDIAFSRWKVCVLVDGCFWHSCPEHGALPHTNRDWWQWKLTRTRARDIDTDSLLASLGWTVVRVWEHTPPSDAADLVDAVLREKQAARP